MFDKKKCVLALGFFDGVHLGHKKVIEKTIEIAKKYNALPIVVTFNDDLRSVLSKTKCPYINSQREKECILEKLGVKNVYFAPTSIEFLSKDKREFLDFLNEKFDVCGYVSGLDYKFGKNAEGNADFLTEYAKAHSQEYVAIDIVSVLGEKISSTNIKDLLMIGQIERANSLLAFDYFIMGNVSKDRGVGTSLGFPTINVLIDEERVKLKNGVYSGKVLVDGKMYKAMINYGARPTFYIEKINIEAHLLDFNGNLYGKEVTIYFSRFLREIKKFDNSSLLIEQLQRDEMEIRKND